MAIFVNILFCTVENMNRNTIIKIIPISNSFKLLYVFYCFNKS